MTRTLAQRLIRMAIVAAVVASIVILADPYLTTLKADGSFTGFVGGNLVVSRGLYSSPGPASVVGQIVPGSRSATAFTSTNSERGRSRP